MTLSGAEPLQAGQNMFIDTHCHLDLIKDNPLHQTLQKAMYEGVEQIVIPGLCPSQWSQIQLLGEQYSQLYFTVGLHPWWIEEELQKTNSLAQLKSHIDESMRSYLSHPNCLGVGECGLDGHIDTPIQTQEQLLDCQIQLALETSKPIILHSRKTHHILLHHLKKLNTTRNLRGVLHAFSGSEEQAKLFIQHGLLLGIGGTITYSRARKTRQAVQNLPIDTMVLETDAPDMPLYGFQGQQNTPAQIKLVAQHLAELRNDTIETIAFQTNKNAHALFNFPDAL